MTATAIALLDPPSTDIATAASRLYDAECSLHAARQSQVDAWIAAAADKLHAAVEAYLAAAAAAIV